MSVNFPEEITHLEMVEDKLQETLVKLDKSVADYEKEYMKGKRYLVANWNEIDSMEKFSNERSLSEIENAGNLSLEKRDKIKKLIDAPYFARVDFQYAGEKEAEPIYIGPFSFADNDCQMLIYDWRAPVSSLYYDYELGAARYEAPIGTIAGEVVLKRQFKIVSGRMEYALESAINIGDDVLQRELSSTSNEKMKTIIATIQKEQNQIIRNDKAGVLIIQGVAGSGKTSIALHRVAYMLYRHKDELLANNVAIISPNKVFADYISNVLPELGEEPIVEISFEDIAQGELTGVLQFERFTDQLDNPSRGWLERSCFKSALDFSRRIDEYLDYAAATYFEACDCSFGGISFSKSYLEERYQAYQKRPIFKRFTEMANEIFERIKTDNINQRKLVSRKEIAKKLTAMFRFKDTLALYTDFYAHIGRPEMFVMAGRNKLEWPDVFPYLYLKIFTEGVDGLTDIQHLVIDEMQDYTPIQYAVINAIFRCKKTILGDVGQAVNPYNRHSLSVFKELFADADFVELNKSYRSTYEIMEFAKRIQNHQQIEPAPRHGEEPEILGFESQQAELIALKDKVSKFRKGKYATLGILCKTSKQANAVYKELVKEYPVFLLDANSTKFENGITVTTIFLSKGLEFDEVVIPSVTAKSYTSEHDRSLLYVGCTRAMHKLTISYHGELAQALLSLEQ